jgi:hypothetical protein
MRRSPTREHQPVEATRNRAKRSLSLTRSGSDRRQPRGARRLACLGRSSGREARVISDECHPHYRVRCAVLRERRARLVVVDIADERVKAGCMPPPAASSACATASPALTAPGPTAKQSASSRPSPTVGPTARSTPTQPNRTRALPGWLTHYNFTDDTAPSAANHPRRLNELNNLAENYN